MIWVAIFWMRFGRNATVKTMPYSAIYDAMVVLQWAALPTPAERQHATVRAIVNGEIRLCMSQPLFDEIRGLLCRKELREKLPSLTPASAALVLKRMLEFADWFDPVPNVFTWPQHPDDDHLFNLAIHAKAQYLVTWETRILKLAADTIPAADVLRRLAPDLTILTPRQLADKLR